MADFLKAWAATSTFEGGYANDPDDSGGETYRGISRVHNPKWPGWHYVDEAKKLYNFPSNLKENVTVDGLVVQFYEEIWDRLPCKLLPQEMAEVVFDTAVNMGSGTAVRFLQEALNALNCNQAYWPDVKVDGGFGPKTAAALVFVMEDRGEADLLAKVYSVIRGDYFLEIMKKKPSQEKFARSWFRRVKL